MSKLTLETVYIPVKKVLSRDIIEYIKETFTRYASKDYIVSELEKDFESKEGIFFTQEEYNKHIKEIIENTLRSGAKNANVKDFKVNYTGVRAGGFYIEKIIDKDSILNTFEETYLKYKL